MAADLGFPPIFLLPTHLDADRLHELEEMIPSLTYDIQEAEVILGNISKRQRALFELRQRKLQTVPLEIAIESQTPSSSHKRKRDEGSGESDSSACTEDCQKIEPAAGPGPRALLESPDDGIVRVVKLNWLTESLIQGRVLPLRDFVIYEGHKCVTRTTLVAVKDSALLACAAADKTSLDHQNALRPLGENASGSASQRTTVPSLLRQTTSEHDSTLTLPPIPGYLRTTYACQRATSADPPNAAFIEEVKAIRTTRKLMGDQIGVRAYSTSIATLSAYPYQIRSPQEVARLPGCGHKIAELWHEWKDAGRLREASEAQVDTKLSVLRTFYDIWGVGDATARDFYKKGWRNLDDIVQYGWDGLSRVQQIGVKFYEELKLKIPRAEVESIASTILNHARDFSPGYRMVIVGGYRRGKQASGDVDVIISHPDESATLNFVERLVVRLEKSGQITHTLTLSNHNSERGQRPLSWNGNQATGGGFDTLDKALVVWQEPETSERGKSSNVDFASQRSPHRRVDIIISPWKTVGCAVLGWSGDTTFQRDLRRYCKKQRDLKFDSSGIRSRLDGSWVDLEGNGKAPDMLTAERRVFEGLGLDWVRPEDRCTG